MHYDFTNAKRQSKIRNATQRQPSLRLKFGVFSLVTAFLFSFANIANASPNIQSHTSTSTDCNTYGKIAEAVSAPNLNIPKLSSQDQYGCSAYLCFAGGFVYPECQKVIRKVTRDLLRGKAFPSCSALSNSDGSVGGQNGSPRIFTQKTRKYIKIMKQNADGSIEQISSIKRKSF